MSTRASSGKPDEMPRGTFHPGGSSDTPSHPMVRKIRISSDWLGDLAPVKTSLQLLFLQISGTKKTDKTFYNNYYCK